MNLSDIRQKLMDPFDPNEVQWKPQVTTKDKKQGMAVAFVGPRTYEERLDAVCSNEWSSEVKLSHFAQVVEKASWKKDREGNFLKEPAVMGFVHAVVRLTVCGITRSDVGEADAEDSNAATIATAQAFKRACSSFGLGRYLYHIPKVWKNLDEKGFFTPQALNELKAVISAGVAGPQGGSPPSRPQQATPAASPASRPTASTPARPVTPPAAPPAAPTGHVPPPAAPTSKYTRKPEDKLTPEQVEKMKALKVQLNIKENSELDYYIDLIIPDAKAYIKQHYGADAPLSFAITGGNFDPFHKEILNRLSSPPGDM